jgi:hypothetical protein
VIQVTKKKRGRPSRKAASRAALADVDVAAVDPITVLLAVAGDESAPASARVAAARALLRAGVLGKPENPSESAESDPIARRALKILNGGKR